MSDEFQAEIARLEAQTKKRSEEERAEWHKKRVHNPRQSLDPADRRSWDIKRVQRWYLQRFRQTYPAHASINASAIVTPKVKGQIKNLVKFLTPEGTGPSEGIAAAVEYIDHAFTNQERVSAGLKLSGPITAGVLLGFRDALYQDWKGTRLIGSSRVANVGRESDANDDGFGMASTSDLL